jgi:hypothetical protein
MISFTVPAFILIAFALLLVGGVIGVFILVTYIK